MGVPVVLVLLFVLGKGDKREARNPKSECRKKSEIPGLKNRCGINRAVSNPLNAEKCNSDFGLRNSFGFRTSDFGFTSLACPGDAHC